jgi:glyoxylase-like metal-dependent hydrolase (beta-lactamase superfamily II)
MATQLAPGLYRLGTGLVNWYLVEADGRFTVVDAALRGYRPQLDEALADLGRRIDDVEAVVLTHGHGDHTGAAESIRLDAGAPVYLHPGDEEMARTGRPQVRRPSLLLELRRPGTWGLLAHFARNGLAPTKIGALRPIGDGDVLEVPGRPRAIHTPGHSNGHVVLHFERHDALIAGDALCTLHPFRRRRGPQLMPSAFNTSTEHALESLGRLEDIDAPLLLVGHGEPWTQGPAAAVARAREVGPT